MRQRDENCCLTRLLASNKPPQSSSDSYTPNNKPDKRSQQPSTSNCRVERSHLITMKYYQHLINNMTLKLYKSAGPSAGGRGRKPTLAANSMVLLPLLMVISLSINSFHLVASSPSHTSHQQQKLQTGASTSAKIKETAAAAAAAAAEALLSQQLPAQARASGLDPADYIDEAGELEVLAGQQQIPTAQLMAAAGHIVPDNFFMPGGSIPAAHYVQQQRYLQQAQQQAQQLHQQSQAEQMREVAAAAASQLQARIVPAPGRYAAGRSLAPIDLLVAAATEQLHHQQQQQQQQQQQMHKEQHNAQQQQQLQQQQQQQQHQQAQPENQNQISSLVDFNGYNLAAQPDLRDSGAGVDLAEFLASSPQTPNGQSAQLAAALYEHQLAAAIAEARHQQQHQPADGADRQHAASLLAEHMQALASGHQQQQQLDSASSEANEHYQLAAGANSNIIGPDYQLIGASSDYAQAGHNEKEHQQQQHQQQHQQNQKPFGLPTKSSSKEPSGMLKPLGNPKTVSSPVIDFVANNLPKTSTMEKLAEKLPQHQTPTVFSFASSKDPTEKVKAVNQKKRNVMRQAEQMARMLIKSVNEKFGTTIGDQSDIPFLLSSLGPLGFAQNILLDPTLLVTLLNSAEKTYFSDVLPGPAKTAIRPVLNIFRVPNKKRDKANLLNIISYLTSGGQTSATVPSKHRASFGIEKAAGGSSASSSNNNINKNKDKSRR